MDSRPKRRAASVSTKYYGALNAPGAMSSFFGGQSQAQPASNIFGNLGTSTSSSAQSQPQQTSSFFSSSQPQQTGNIFGNLNTSKPQSTPSLFSNLGDPSTSQATGSVFGTPASSQPQQAELFGTLGSTTATTSQPQQGGIFGSSGGTTVTSSQPQQGGIFGSLGGPTGTSSQPQQGGAFGSFGGTNSTTSQPQNPAFSFGTLGGSTATASQPQQPGLSFGTTGANTNQTQNQQPSGQPAQSNGSTPHSAYFNSLLEKNRKRDRAAAKSDSGFGEVPSLQLGLGDIAKRVRELGGTGVQNLGRGTDSKAHYLLAASGVNPGAALRDLNAFNAQASPIVGTQPRPDWDPDSHKYVEQLMEQSTMDMIQEGISISHRNFDAFIEEHVDIDWNGQRKKLYEHFGLVPKARDKLSDSTFYSTPGGKGSFGRPSRAGRGSKAGPDRQETPGRSVFGKSGMQKSVIGTPGVGSDNAPVFRDVADKSSQGPSAQDDRFLREKQSRFADKVQRMNEARLQELAYPVLQEFADVEGQPGGDSPSQLLDVYKAMIEIVKENPEATSLTDPRAVRERQFADEYLEESPQSANALKMRRTILDGSRRALEKQFFAQLESLVARNPREASLGGIPTVLNKVRAYIRLRNSRKDLAPGGIILQQLNDDYCWALIFFLLRSGLVNEAAEYVTNNSVAFRALDRNFITYIAQYASSPNRRLNRHNQDRINTDYQQRSRIAPENTLDPYRMACYKVIGRCELSKRCIDGISQGVEDWIWLQFALAREVNRAEEAANEVYGLEEVRDTIREIGQRHFLKGSEGPGGYGTYFFLQVLGGLFEQAVTYLYSHSYISAVHFAIALDFYGLLRVADSFESELLTYNTKELPQINFGRMVGYYTRDFRAGNVVAAVDYLTLICLNADLPGEIGKSQSLLCHEALRELVLETREFAQLLGDIRGDGVRIRGAIEQRLKLIGIADQEGFLRTVTLQAASVAADNGRTTDAVLLYHLAEDYDDVITIINRALSDAIAVDIGQEQARLQPLKPRTGSELYQRQQQQPDNSSLSLTTVDDPAVLARNMISLYNENALYYQKIRPINRETCGVLLRISEAKAKVESGQWAEALDIISSLKLLPLNANSSIPIIRAHAQTLTTLHPTLSRLAGPLLLWTITCISRQREMVSGEGGQGGFESDTRRAMREELVGKAKDLMTFAGLVKLRLGKDVWDGIVGGAGELGVY